MNKFAYAGVVVAALVAIPAMAQMGGERQGPRAEPITRTAVQSMVQARFGKADGNRDGFVTRAEAETRIAAAREQRQAKRGERRAQIFDRLDADKNGSISRAEFDARAAARPGHRGERAEGQGGRRMMRHGRMMRGRHGAMAGGGMGKAGHGFGAAMFERLDADRDGRVSLAEASARALARFDRADADRDGTVTLEERRAAMQRFREARQDRRGS